MIYQDATFKICLSLFGWKVNIVPKMHIVQWMRLEPRRAAEADCLPWGRSGRLDPWQEWSTKMISRVEE